MQRTIPTSQAGTRCGRRAYEDRLSKENRIAEARDAFSTARGIETALVEAHPDIAQFKQDLDWLDEQIAALENLAAAKRDSSTTP